MISVEPDQMPQLWHLKWVYTVCSGLFVPVLRIIMISNELNSKKQKWVIYVVKNRDPDSYTDVYSLIRVKCISNIGYEVDVLYL